MIAIYALVPCFWSIDKIAVYDVCSSSSICGGMGRKQQEIGGKYLVSGMCLADAEKPRD